MGMIMGFIGLIGMLIFYFLPTIIAANHEKKNTASIFILNLFLGWTILGWVMALIWANMSED